MIENESWWLFLAYEWNAFDAKENINILLGWEKAKLKASTPFGWLHVSTCLMLNALPDAIISSALLLDLIKASLLMYSLSNHSIGFVAHSTVVPSW